MPPIQPGPEAATSFASLRASIEADAARERASNRWLQALILATLAAIIAKLEHMLELWQAGLFPTPQPRTRRAPAENAARPCERSRAARARPLSAHSTRAHSTNHVGLPCGDPGRASGHPAAQFPPHIRHPASALPAPREAAIRTPPWHVARAPPWAARRDFRASGRGCIFAP